MRPLHTQKFFYGPPYFSQLTPLQNSTVGCGESWLCIAGGSRGNCPSFRGQELLPLALADLAQTGHFNPATPPPPDESEAMGGCLNHPVAVMRPTAPSVRDLKEEGRTHSQHNQREQLASIWRSRDLPPGLLPPPPLWPECWQQEQHTSAQHTACALWRCSVLTMLECRGNIEPDTAAETLPQPSVLVLAVRQAPSPKKMAEKVWF